MGLKSCEIYFDNDTNTYYAGQTVNGRVDLTCDSEKKVRGVKILIKGEARTEWTETEERQGHDGKTETYDVPHVGHEQYFNIEYYLIGGVSSQQITITPGTNSYQFTCALPPTLPSSFEGDHGYVRYTVKVTLDRPWKFDQETKVAFTVLSPLDLNLTPSLKEKVKRVREKTFCCLCCKSGPLTVIVSIPCSGFVPGQKIIITSEIDNASDVDLEELKYELRKIVTFHVYTPNHKTKQTKTVIASLKFGSVNGGESRTSTHEIEIPPIPPSNLTNCGIIDVDYELKAESSVSGAHFDFDMTLPITIGTIPLASFVPSGLTSVLSSGENLSQPVIGGNVSPGQIGWNAPSPNQSPYPMSQNPTPYPPYPTSDASMPPPFMPPPTFAESQFGTKSIHDSGDNEYTKFVQNSQSYAPRYPVYSFSPSAPPQL